MGSHRRRWVCSLSRSSFSNNSIRSCMACSRVLRGGDLAPGISAAGSISEAAANTGVEGRNWLLGEVWNSETCSAKGEAGPSLLLLASGIGISPDKEAAREILLLLCKPKQMGISPLDDKRALHNQQTDIKSSTTPQPIEIASDRLISKLI